MSEQEILDVDVVEVTVGRRSHSVRPGGGVVFLQESGCKLVAAIPSHEKMDKIFLLKFFPLRRFGFWSKFVKDGVEVPEFQYKISSLHQFYRTPRVLVF
jgi:hypothetical protein